MIHVPRRAVRMLLALLASLGCVLVATVPAYADPAIEADAAAAAFGSGEHVYVSADAGQKIDAAAVADEIGDDPVYVAVVPPNTSPSDVLTQLQNNMQQKGTYVVISGAEQQAQSNAICSDQAQPLLDDAAEEQQQARQSGDLTSFVTAYVEKLADAPEAGDSDCADGGDDDGGSALPWILGALLIGAGGGYLWLRNRRRHKSVHDAGRRQKVTDALDALARDIDAVGDGGGPQVQRALDDARERHIAAADILAEADTDSDFDAAMRATREGAFAAHYARERAGLQTAPPREIEPARGERLSAERAVMIGEDQVTAYPSYRPGAPYYFRGNRDLPAAWYTAPVGEDHLLGSISDEE